MDGLEAQKFILCEPIFETIYNEEDNPYDIKNRVLNDTSIRNFEECQEVIEGAKFLENNAYGYEVDLGEGFFKLKSKGVSKERINGKDYHIVVGGIYYPFQSIIEDLVPVYLFSLIMVVVLSMILSRGL